METEETVTISKADYESLKEDSELLGLLQRFGVEHCECWVFAEEEMKNREADN